MFDLTFFSSNVAPSLRQNGDPIKADLRLAAAACVCLNFLLCLSYLWALVGSYGSVFREITEPFCWFLLERRCA